MAAITITRVFFVLLIVVLLFVLTAPPTEAAKSPAKASGASAGSKAKQVPVQIDEDEEDDEDDEDEVADAEEEEDDDEDDEEDEVEVTTERTFAWANTVLTTSLWEMVSQNNIDGLRQLLTRDPLVVHERSADGRGMLWWAYEYGMTEIVELAKEYGADEEAKDKDGNKPADMAKGGEL